MTKLIKEVCTVVGFGTILCATYKKGQKKGYKKGWRDGSQVIINVYETIDKKEEAKAEEA